MKSIENTSLDAFYQQAAAFTGKDIQTLLPPGIHKEIGHFNVFDLSETIRQVKQEQVMPYNRRAYYPVFEITDEQAEEAGLLFRMIQEAKILLKQTDWNISEIADSLGFEEVAHFSNFFKKQTTIAPLASRS